MQGDKQIGAGALRDPHPALQGNIDIGPPGQHHAIATRALKLAGQAKGGGQVDILFEAVGALRAAVASAVARVDHHDPLGWTRIPRRRETWSKLRRRGGGHRRGRQDGARRRRDIHDVAVGVDPIGRRKQEAASNDRLGRQIDL